MPGSVRSEDGTAIAFERAGTGPPLILVGGGLTDRAENALLVPLLAERFTVVNYDRRGRGGSGDTPPYALARELEDLEALIAATGGPVHLFGASSGGALALEAAAAGLAIDRVAVYEVPCAVGEEALRQWRAYVDELGAALAAGDAMLRRVSDPTRDLLAGLARQTMGLRPGFVAVAFGHIRGNERDPEELQPWVEEHGGWVDHPRCSCWEPATPVVRAHGRLPGSCPGLIDR
jgi:pimeloyl-ACP methyl ester carboxylesterase